MKNPVPLTISERRRYFAGAILCFLLTTPAVANAQGAFLERPADLGSGQRHHHPGHPGHHRVGLVMLSMRASFVAIFAVCAGIWVIFNANTLAGLAGSKMIEDEPADVTCWRYRTPGRTCCCSSL